MTLSGDNSNRRTLEWLFRVAVAAADPARVVPPALPDLPRGRTVVIGAGKAAAGMAAAVEAHWQGPLEGLVITRYGHSGDKNACKQIHIIEAAHPVPDEAGRQATDQICNLLQGLNEDDLVISLISGGGSALLSKPLPGITLEDKQGMTSQLLVCGADIAEMNVVRQHLSAVKAGRLAAMAAPARMVSLLISDVPGDIPQTIASGPTVASGATRQDALDILKRYDIRLPQHVRHVLNSDLACVPDPLAPFFARNEVKIIASARLSLEAARGAAASKGLRAIILSDRIEGEARNAGQILAMLALQSKTSGEPFEPPVILLSGGETSVTVTGRGRGGRNAEFALSAALALQDTPGICGLAADTDGIDGTEDNAGALFTNQSCAQMRQAGINPVLCLHNNDAYTAFQTIDDLFVTGPTGTNVNDFRAFLITGGVISDR